MPNGLIHIYFFNNSRKKHHSGCTCVLPPGCHGGLHLYLDVPEQRFWSPPNPPYIKEV